MDNKRLMRLLSGCCCTLFDTILRMCLQRLWLICEWREAQFAEERRAAVQGTESQQLALALASPWHLCLNPGPQALLLTAPLPPKKLKPCKCSQGKLDTGRKVGGLCQGFWSPWIHSSKSLSSPWLSIYSFERLTIFFFFNRGTNSSWDLLFNKLG